LLVWFLLVYRLKRLLISALQTCEHDSVNYNSFVLEATRNRMNFMEEAVKELREAFARVDTSKSSKSRA
jgi:hypothetical protein